MRKTQTEILKSLILLAVPTIMEQIMSTLMQYVDTAMVGRLGEEATAAVSTTTTVTWLVGSVPMAISTAAVALIARANGAGDKQKTKRLAGQAAYLTLTVGAVTMLLCLFLSPYIPVWMGAEKRVQRAASGYFFILSLSLVFRTSAYVFGGAIRAMKNTRLPMLINLTANVLNVILNYFLIYALHMGVAGAAAASSLSYVFAGTAMVVFARKNDWLRWKRADFWPDGEGLRSYGQIGLPAMGASMASCLGYVFFAGMVSGMGTTIFAAHSIAVTAEELFYMPGYGLRTATSSLIGNALGEGDARKLRVTEHLGILLTLGMMVVNGVLLYLVAYPLMCFFTSSGEVAALGARMLRLVALSEPFFGLMIALEGIFYGKGKTKNIFYVETGSMWGIRIFFTFLCVKIWHLDLQAVWYCMIADNICKAVLLLAVYLREKRRT